MRESFDLSHGFDENTYQPCATHMDAPGHLEYASGTPVHLLAERGEQ